MYVQLNTEFTIMWHSSYKSASVVKNMLLFTVSLTVNDTLSGSHENVMPTVLYLVHCLVLSQNIVWAFVKRGRCMAKVVMRHPSQPADP